MTPDVVIYRYLQIIASTECDVDELCLLLSADADLLVRWLNLLNVPADIDALQSRISNLDVEEFTTLAQAQAWSVLPIVGSARLSIDQWLGVLRAACLAEVLVEHINHGPEHTDPDKLVLSQTAVRLRVLLAISGVNLDQDKQLNQLIEFRGTNPALLEDAGLELRIFTVVDAMEVGREVELAESLLDIPATVFASLLDEAESVANKIVTDLAIDTGSDINWAHRIWLRQQISTVATSLRQCANWDELYTAHTLASRSLFSKAPMIVVQRDVGLPLVQLGSLDFAINLDSRTSLIAAAARGSKILRLGESADLAVVDRLLLRALGSEQAFAVPLNGSVQPALLLVAEEEDSDIELTAELYAEAMSAYLPKFHSSAQPSTNNSDALVEQFRANEYKRLREIVHEANNPLSIVHNYLHILELRLQHEPEAVEQLELVASELRRAGELFTRARDVPLETQVDILVPGEVIEIDITTWVTRLAELSRGLAADAGVALSSNLPNQPVLIRTEQDKLTQIMSNLIKNAVEACEPADEVLVGARGGVYRDGRVGVELFVEDSGPGLSDEILHNLAGVKRSDKGGEHQGVGLQVAFRLASELDGAIDVRTELGQGTRFSLFLPHKLIPSASALL